MIIKPIHLLIVLMAYAVSACSAPPYVLNANEFNRGSVNFGHEPEDITDVTICYQSNGTTPEQVMSLASERCQQYGKKAVYDSQNYTMCPLLTPSAATFICEKPTENPSLYNFESFQY